MRGDAGLDTDVRDGDGKNRTDSGYVLEAEWAGRDDTQDVGGAMEKKKKKEEFVKQLSEQKYQMERWRPGSLWGGGRTGYPGTLDRWPEILSSPSYASS